MRSKIMLFLGLVVVFSMLFTACGGPAAVVPTPETRVEVQVQVVTATPEPKEEVVYKSADPTTFVDMTTGEPDTLDPALAYDSASGGVLMNTYDPLIFYRRESISEFVPMLATEVPSKDNGGISADGKTYTFKIRPGVKFHNGDELKPSDVAFTFVRNMLSGGTSSPQWLLFEPIMGSTSYNDVSDLIPAEALAKLNEALAAAVPTPEAGVTPEAPAFEALETLADDRPNLQELAKIDPAAVAKACEDIKSHIVADDAAGTVTFTLSQTWGPFLVTLTGMWGSILEQKWVTENGGWDGDCTTWQNFYAPTSEELSTTTGKVENGTGPYILESWTPKDSLVYKANENYWPTEPIWEGGPSGAPALKKVIVKYVDEFSTRFAAFQAGDADFIAAGSPENWPQLDTLVGEVCDSETLECKPSETSPDAAMRVFDKVKGVTRSDAFFNLKVNTAGGNNFLGSGQLDGNGIPADFFSDIHIRKAFEYCFDWETYIADVQQGYGKQANAVMLFGEIGDDPDSPKYSFDLAKCEEEFKASTWKSADGTSLWDLGFRMSMTFNTGNTARQSICQIWQQNVNLVNPKFVVEIVGLPWPTFLTNQRQKKLPFFVLGWIEDIPDPHNWVFTYAAQGGAWAGRQSIPQEIFDKLAPYITSGATEPDPVKRAEIYKQFNQVYYDEALAVLLAQMLGKHYEQRWVKGYYNNPIYSDWWWYAFSKN